MDDSEQAVMLVLTDVVDSTKLAAALGDARNAALWDEHDRVARGLVAEWNGVEVERTDGILALFERHDAALAFAAAYRDALAALEPPLTARVGVHRGPLVVRDNPSEHVARGAKPIEADGLSLSVTARVNSVARGGQILLTEAAIENDADVRSHGHWQLKGAPEVLELFEAPQGWGEGEPPVENEKAYRVVRDGQHWVPVRDVPRQLPAEWDPFVGRRSDLAALQDRIEEGRLVTVTGIGGTGKTRLVTHFGWAHLGDYRGGVWFSDLSEAEDVQDVVRAVATALGVPLGGGDSVRQLAHAITDRGRCLVILDNFEQVVEHAASTVAHWLASSAEARFVVTSRERLRIPGEVTLELSPLAARDSAALFCARAHASHAGFDMNDDPAAVVDLVRLLDHLPLAIELAAARVRVLSPRAMLERMAERFRLLSSTSARRDRQATLRTTLDWSWDLLDANEQTALAQVSVFEGGFTLEAAEAVLQLPDAWPVDAVQSLVDKSLVRRASDERFDQLVSVQSYAKEKLEAFGQQDEARSRHGAYFAALGEDEIASDLHNVVAACRRAARRGDADTAVRTLKTAWAVLDRRGPPALAAALAQEVGDLPGLAPGLTQRLHAEALLAQGEHAEGQQALRTCLQQLGFPEPRSFFPGLVARIMWGLFTQARRRFGALPGPPGDSVDVVMAATRAYQRLVETYWFVNAPPRMLGSAITALNLCEPLGPTPELARAYATLALATSGMRFDDVADRYADRALETAMSTGSPLAEGYVRFLACVYRVGHARWPEVADDVALATSRFEEAEDHRLLGDAITVDGMSLLYQGQFAQASERFVQVLRAGRAQGNAQHQVWGALGDAEAMLRQGDPHAALDRMAEAMAVLDHFASPTEAARAWGLMSRVELAVGQPQRARAAADEAHSRLQSLGPPTAHYLLEGYACTAEVLLELGAPAGRAMSLMRRFAHAFPIGKPRLSWLQATEALAHGRKARAASRVVAGLEAAEELGMPYELGRLAELWPLA